MLQKLARLDELPDNPDLSFDKYAPTVSLWRTVKWTLTPAQFDIFPSTAYSDWPENYPPVSVDENHLIDLKEGGPSMLLMGCSYIAGDYLDNANRLIFKLRDRLPNLRISCIASSGGGLVTNLAHISHLLPRSYEPEFIVLAPTQSFRQYIPESTVQFNRSPYALWQHYYWFSSQSASKRKAILQELCLRDCMRLDYLFERMFPRSRVMLVLFDATGTGEISLLEPRERDLLEGWAARHPQAQMLFDRDETLRLYSALGPFDKKHPNASQIEAIADRVAMVVLSACAGVK